MSATRDCDSSMAPVPNDLPSVLAAWSYQYVGLIALLLILVALEKWIRWQVNAVVQEKVHLYRQVDEMKISQMKEGHTSAVSRLNSDIINVTLKVDSLVKENERLKGDNLSSALQLQQLVQERNSLSEKVVELNSRVRDMDRVLSDLRESNLKLSLTCETDKATIARLETALSELTRKYDELKNRQDNVFQRHFSSRHEERHIVLHHRKTSGSKPTGNQLADKIVGQILASQDRDKDTAPVAALTDADIDSSAASTSESGSDPETQSVE